MEDFSVESRHSQQKDFRDRIIQVGPCNMVFDAGQDRSVEEPPAPHDNPNLMPLRNSSHLVQHKDSREDPQQVQIVNAQGTMIGKPCLEL